VAGKNTEIGPSHEEQSTTIRSLRCYVHTVRGERKIVFTSELRLLATDTRAPRRCSLSTVYGRIDDHVKARRMERMRDARKDTMRRVGQDLFVKWGGRLVGDPIKVEHRLVYNYRRGCTTSVSRETRVTALADYIDDRTTGWIYQELPRATSRADIDRRDGG